MCRNMLEYNQRQRIAFFTSQTCWIPFNLIFIEQAGGQEFSARFCLVRNGTPLHWQLLPGLPSKVEFWALSFLMYLMYAGKWPLANSSRLNFQNLQSFTRKLESAMSEQKRGAHAWGCWPGSLQEAAVSMAAFCAPLAAKMTCEAANLPLWFALAEWSKPDPSWSL